MDERGGSEESKRRAVVLFLATLAILIFFVFDIGTQENEEQAVNSAAAPVARESPPQHRAVPVAEEDANLPQDLRNPFTEEHETRQRLQAEDIKDANIAELLPKAQPPSLASASRVLPSVPMLGAAKSDDTLPKLTGIAADENMCLAILSCGDKAATLAVGESFVGYEVLFIDATSVTLKKDGRTIKMELTQ